MTDPFRSNLLGTIVNNLMDMTIRKILFSIVLCTVSVMSVAAADYGQLKDEKAFLAELQRRNSAISSIQAKFVQTKFLSVFSTEMKSDGNFYWQKSDKICLDYLSPVKYRIVINGDKLKTVSSGKSSVISTKGNPMMDQMNLLITACMTGNISLMGASFRVSIEESANDYRITIQPQSQQVKNYISKMEIHLSRKDMSVTELYMYENANDYTGYVFSQQKFNETIPSSVFDVR